MEAKAVGKFIRVSTRKARIPAQIIKGMSAVEAVYVLKYMPKGAAHPVKKVLESAIANAVHNLGMKQSDLVVSEVLVDK
ncbi:partial 50S ribosomal protein L22, partial [Patescibacteria group bacterium]